MIRINIQGENGFVNFTEIEVWHNSTCYKGGYDGIWEIHLKSDNYVVKDKIYISTGELYILGEQIRKIYLELDGKAELDTAEHDFNVIMQINKLGQVLMTGFYKAHPDRDTSLEFEIITNQSFLKSSIEQFHSLIKKYGDLKGI